MNNERDGKDFASVEESEMRSRTSTDYLNDNGD